VHFWVVHFAFCDGPYCPVRAPTYGHIATSRWWLCTLSYLAQARIGLELLGSSSGWPQVARLGLGLVSSYSAWARGKVAPLGLASSYSARARVALELLGSGSREGCTSRVGLELLGSGLGRPRVARLGLGSALSYSAQAWVGGRSVSRLKFGRRPVGLPPQVWVGGRLSCDQVEVGRLSPAARVPPALARLSSLKLHWPQMFIAISP